MSLEKLKDTARKFEQKEDWRKAIEAYVKAIQQMESGREAAPDLSLYNRVGDLYLKINDTQAAVRHYERAVDIYADQGFFNNAIALCGKILRVNPGRTQTYLKLAQLHARKNVVIEAKRNLLEFIERMNAQGQLDEAFGAVKDFADQFSGSQEIRLMLVELLRASRRTEEAHEQLDKLCDELEASGDVRRVGRASGWKRRRRSLRAAAGGAGGSDFSGHRLRRRHARFPGIGAAGGIPDPEPAISLIEPPPPVEEVESQEVDGLVVAETPAIEPLGGFESTQLDVPADAAAGAGEAGPSRSSMGSRSRPAPSRPT